MTEDEPSAEGSLGCLALLALGVPSVLAVCLGMILFAMALDRSHAVTLAGAGVVLGGVLGMWGTETLWRGREEGRKFAFVAALAGPAALAIALLIDALRPLGNLGILPWPLP